MDQSKHIKRYALVGAGGRATMFVNPICRDYPHDAMLVGMCDTNQGRLDYYQQKLIQDFAYQKVPTYLANNFDQMLIETRPDVIIVSTVDCFHHDYIVRAMEAGCDVITEKPMTTDLEKCQQILDTIERTGKTLRVTFNYRWEEGPTQVRRAIASGVIGEVIHIDMEYMLNTSHGADYFRRWHRKKENSGGLMVHKSTHHFDLINWWIDAIPVTVFGMGRLAFYGKDNAKARGVKANYPRYTGHNCSNDPFALDLSSDPNMKQLYLDNEKYDGYLRDCNVFAENHNIEDTMSVMVRYNNGVVLNYSLNSYLPCEGYTVAINGTKGRLEYRERHGSHIITGQDDTELAEQTHWDPELTIKPLFKPEYNIPIHTAKGGHGGADPAIQEQMFSSNPPAENDGRNAGHQQGAASILIGIAANESFATGLPVFIPDRCQTLPYDCKLHQLI